MGANEMKLICEYPTKEKYPFIITIKNGKAYLENGKKVLCSCSLNQFLFFEGVGITCPKCGKTAQIISEFLGNEKIIREIHFDAKKTGYCKVCGWHDGDGVQTCYYDSEMGAMHHENSMESFFSKLTESQKILYESYHSFKSKVYDKISENKMRKRISKLIKLDGKENSWVVGNCYYSLDNFKTKTEAVEAWLEDRKGLSKLLGNGYIVLRKYVQKETKGSLGEGLFITSYAIQKPHTCGGFGRFAGPYHIECSGCNEEIKMWEYGIDYDIG